jgi:hypothetical protein
VTSAVIPIGLLFSLIAQIIILIVRANRPEPPMSALAARLPMPTYWLLLVTRWSRTSKQMPTTDNHSRTNSIC